ncbi:MAG TPA: hypothetical protein VFQ38_15990 [Longimicrobiales bacterium]|nr:hypothetical protein [Longimicrobiales bacterium]
MRMKILKVIGVGALAAVVLAGAGCNDYLEVENPEVVDAGTVDPNDAAAVEAFSRSALQNLAVAYGWMAMYTGWFSGEALVAETFPTRNEFGRRDVSDRNGSLNTDVWTPISVARASGDKVLQIMAGNANENSSLDVARAALVSGYSFVWMAEAFCQGAIDSGPALTYAMMLDSAVARFTKANAVGTAAVAKLSGSAKTEAQSIANAALVGRARAHLDAGRKTQAAADADQVPAGFVMNLQYIDDLSNRTRLGNRIWQFTLQRGSIAVAPAYRALNDPRVPFNAPVPALVAQDGLTAFYTEAKWTSYSAPVRLASKKEADYISAEAKGGAAALAIINRERAAAGMPAYSGATDDNSVLTELLDQKAREFYLENVHMGDFRRAPNNVKYVPQPGAAYHKPGYDPIKNQTCIPLSSAETDNNPNFNP